MCKFCKVIKHSHILRIEPLLLVNNIHLIQNHSVILALLVADNVLILRAFTFKSIRFKSLERPMGGRV